ncbi:hypothetical protein GCM10009630_65550 [Kribbella jejuensis]|uniref:Galactose mutarotase-like enzyme n=1 Tax=Kribbella jejuensis TaxID=236068 RepID=A0A542EP86_9ACTN|nr:hypothetical protein [Kribbella jejuensis]TQJ17148.1 hypothetical protein FB475_1260 [Kribbella jejuensis]
MVTNQDTAAVAVDIDDGGRWTSLRLAGREWLWSGPGLTDGPRTGLTAFVDAGGVDECFPTIRGTPDHGALWNQPWHRTGADTVSYGAATLTRTFTSVPDLVTVDYRLEAEPGYRFVWAAHALVDCAAGATISAPWGTRSRLYPEAADLLRDAWPPGAPWVTEPWPTQLDLTTYGPTDGTAVGAVLLDCPTISVRDRGAELTMTLSCPEQPTSTALWRNQGGFPADAPYRSLGVEPMLGRVFDLAEAGPGDAAVVPASGELTWQLTLTAKPIQWNQASMPALIGRPTATAIT